MLKGIKKYIFFKFTTSIAHVFVCDVNVTGWSCLLRGFKLKKHRSRCFSLALVLPVFYELNFHLRWKIAKIKNKKQSTRHFFHDTNYKRFFFEQKQTFSSLKLVNSRLLLQFSDVSTWNRTGLISFVFIFTFLSWFHGATNQCYKNQNQ